MLQPSKRTLVEVKEADRAPVPTLGAVAHSARLSNVRSKGMLAILGILVYILTRHDF
jgi:hypothetical protein